MDVIQLLPEFHFLRFPIGHAYLWKGTDGLTLIDSGVPGSAPAIATAIRELGHRPADLRRLILTHFHEDHVGSAADIAAWGEVEVLAHRADAPFIRGDAPGPAPVLAAWERPIFENVMARKGDAVPEPVRVDRELEDGDLIDLGGIEAVAVTAPGHTPGSVTVHIPDARVLVTGDTVARAPDGGDVILGVFNVDTAQAVESFGRLAELDTEIACFGHGEPSTRDARAELRAAVEQLAGRS
ncbi:MBL fold metallo-hydrolase [Actinomadura viridis]|uniref:MBL fold metallo-hydrolase n=1 Tax=Actinomadura viridis TaxID=58110 RepID=UPI0036845004